MVRPLANVPLAITIFWIWVGFVAVVLAAYFVIFWRRRKHTLPLPPPELSYSARLRERLSARPHTRACAPTSGDAHTGPLRE